MQISDTEFNKLIGDVEKEFGAWLAKAEADTSAPENQILSKSDEGEKKDEPKKEEEKEEPKETKPEEKHEDKKEETPEKSEEKHEEKVEEKPDHEQKGEDHGYDDEDMAHMHEMYGSMSRHELKAHHDAVKMALDKCMGAEAEKPMEKSETFEIPDTIATQELELVKSELAAEKTKSEELKKNVDLMTQFLNKLISKTAPQAKAITSLETIAKSESVRSKELSKEEITQALDRKSRDETLSKSDRELINAYYLKNASVETINHLLK